MSRGSRTKKTGNKENSGSELKTPSGTAEQPLTTDKKPPRNAKWTTADDATLVATLREQQAAGNQADSGWKACVWVAAAQALAGSEVQSGGAAKKAKGCSDHWSLLKNNCLIVQKLRGLSGFGWDDSRCLVVAPADVWERYIKDHSDAEVWRTKSFPLYDDIISLIEGRFATGDGAAHMPEEDLDTQTDEELDRQIAEDWGADDSESFDADRTVVVVTPPTTQARHVSKRERPDSPSPNSAPSAKKRSRVTGPTAVLDVADALRSVANSITASDSASSTQIGFARTPERRSRAVKMIAADEGLTKDQRLSAVRLFAKDIAIADTYMAIDDQDLRSDYICAEI